MPTPVSGSGNETPTARLVEAATHAIAEIVRERHRRLDTVAEHMAQMGFPIEVHDEDYADFGRAAVEALQLSEEIRTNDDGFAFHTTSGRSGGRTASQRRRLVTPWQHIPGREYGNGGSVTIPEVAS